MSSLRKSILALTLSLPLLFCPGFAADWKDTLAAELPLLGHRNWIVVVDSAYPLQTSPGIETIETGASQTEVVRAVLDALQKTKHVRPVIYTDEELKSVPEKDAPGIQAYREELTKTLGDLPVTSLLHEQIIAKLDEAGRTFHILVLKTNLTLPYTSVFFQLQCGYWSAEAEANLRNIIQKSAH
jgi:L-fucose mutarotase/ribose pyranase (RbsD/FucU family)